MTPANPDALADARDLIRHSLKVGAPGLPEAAREAVVRSITLKLEGKVFAPLLADLQRVTAERDEAREVVARCNNSFGSYSYHLNPHPAEQIEKVKWQSRSEWQRAEAAEARAAQLQAEVEAKDKAILLLLPFVDYAAGEGLMFVETEDGEHPEMDAADIMAAVAEALGLELGSDAYLSLLPKGYFAIRTALAARAATAREGRTRQSAADQAAGIMHAISKCGPISLSNDRWCLGHELITAALIAQVECEASHD